MPIVINKRKNPVFAVPIKDKITYPFVIGKVINNTVPDLILDYRKQPVGQLFFTNLDSLFGELNIQYSIYSQRTIVAFDIKLLYDDSSLLDQKLLPSGTEFINIDSATNSYGVRKVSVDIPYIQNNGKNNLVGLFIYAYNNVHVSANVNTLDTVYFKKVE